MKTSILLLIIGLVMTSIAQANSERARDLGITIGILVPGEHNAITDVAGVEATEEAVLNSLFMAETMTGHNGRTIKALPVPEVMDLLR